MTANAATPSAAPTTDIWLARQPIVDADRRLVGWEILFRSSQENHSGVTDGNRATSEVMLNTFVELGLDTVVGQHLAFVNLTREFLIGEFPLPACQSQLVLEVLEDVAPTDDVLSGIRRLRAAGYTIALDDVVYHPGLQPLLELASIVKVDLPLTPPDELASHVQELQQHGVHLLAEKVERRSEFELCKQLGFQLFQGYFLSQPEIVQGRKLNSHKLALVDTLAKLNDPAATFSDLESTIERDPGLCVKLLKYVNSSHFGIRREVDSLHRALVLLGVGNIRTITTLLVLADDRSTATVDVHAALTRAWTCRGLVEHRDSQYGHQLFTAGLLSRLDVLMQCPLEEALAGFAMTEDIREGVLNRTGEIGEILDQVECYERGAWDELAMSDENSDRLRTAYLDAIARVDASFGSAT